MIDMCCPECSYRDAQMPGECSIHLSGFVRALPDDNWVLHPAVSRRLTSSAVPVLDSIKVRCPNCGYEAGFMDFVRVRCRECGAEISTEEYKDHICVVRDGVICDSCMRERPRYCVPCSSKLDCPIYQRVKGETEQ